MIFFFKLLNHRIAFSVYFRQEVKTLPADAMRRSELPLPPLPFAGESAHQRYHQTLTDRQLKMISKLEEACRQCFGSGFRGLLDQDS